MVERIEATALDPATRRRLIEQYQAFQVDNLRLFLSLRSRWLTDTARDRCPGLCADVSPLDGRFRSIDRQRLWGWGDGRALGIWSKMLATNRVPDVPADSGSNESLSAGLRRYVDEIAEGLLERYRKGGGQVPFAADLESGAPDPLLVEPVPFSFATLFAAWGFAQYGLLSDDRPMFDLGLGALVSSIGAADALDRLPPANDPETRHGPRMIALGALVDLLETIESTSGPAPSLLGLRPLLVEIAGSLASFVIAHHARRDPVAFWEVGDGRGGPKAREDGRIIVDAGHATEFAGFLAELSRFLPDEQCACNRKVLDAGSAQRIALDIHLFADSVGFTQAGVMCKYTDLETGEFLPDTQARDASGRHTAPWWSVREHAAAAIGLYRLTGDKRCLESYRRAQRASYGVYPHHALDGQMIQTVDAFTAEPVDVAPATGNLDPMHDTRARLREIDHLRALG